MDTCVPWGSGHLSPAARSLMCLRPPRHPSVRPCSFSVALSGCPSICGASLRPRSTSKLGSGSRPERCFGFVSAVELRMRALLWTSAARSCNCSRLIPQRAGLDRDTRRCAAAGNGGLPRACLSPFGASSGWVQSVTRRGGRSSRRQRHGGREVLLGRQPALVAAGAVRHAGARSQKPTSSQKEGKERTTSLCLAWLSCRTSPRFRKIARKSALKASGHGFGRTSAPPAHMARRWRERARENSARHSHASAAREIRDLWGITRLPAPRRSGNLELRPVCSPGGTSRPPLRRALLGLLGPRLWLPPERGSFWLPLEVRLYMDSESCEGEQRCSPRRGPAASFADLLAENTDLHKRVAALQRELLDMEERLCEARQRVPPSEGVSACDSSTSSEEGEASLVCVGRASWGAAPGCGCGGSSSGSSWPCRC